MPDIYIGSAPDQYRAERVLVDSIRGNSAQANITVMRSGEGMWADWKNPGPTGFTLFRFAIPELRGFRGTGIYLDCDMLVLKDIAGLMEYARPGKWVQSDHRQGDCVSVIDCAVVKELTYQWPSIDDMKRGKYTKKQLREYLSPLIEKSVPDEWNSLDCHDENTALVHYTELATQPWTEGVVNHPNPDCVALWNAHEAICLRQ